jgi:hypothetical protein
MTKKTTWTLDKILRSIFYVFDNAPARREDYIIITGNSSFPKSFCATRWLDDLPVAQRAIKIWDNIKKYVNETIKKPKSQIPSCESFKVVQQTVSDVLVVAKLEYLVSVSNQLRPFLAKYQTDAQMMAFLAYDLEVLLRSLMERFIKADQMASANTAAKLAALDVDI